VILLRRFTLSLFLASMLLLVFASQALALASWS
jgi:hypothetical protein